MKPCPANRVTPGLLLPTLALLAAGLALPLPALSAAVELATSPMATSTTTTVKPNLMFVLDDSGSMDWDFMPDTAKNFAGKYGFNSSQCNGTFYNPAITYSAPVNSTGGPLNATPTTFTAAYKDGYNTSAGTTDLSTGFRGGSGSGASGISLTAGPAFYYTYSGAQITNAQQNFNNTNSIFYRECNSSIGSTTVYDGTRPVNTVFTKVRLAATPTTTITVSGSGGASGATITINSISSRTKVSNVKVGSAEILSGITSRSSTASTVANNIAAGINNCTSAITGNCTVTGYSATSSGSVVTIVGPAAANGVMPAVTKDSGDATFVITAFPTATDTSVSSITVNGVQLLSAAASGTTTTALASDIRSKITLNGYSATVSNNVVTVTGPTTASTYTPVITIGSGSMTMTTEAFPESTPAKLQNFANWYSYYSNRMLMMKTATGLAFNQVSDAYRVGFMSMNNNVSPGLVEVGTFDATKRSAWFSALYAANPANATPLREALSKVGQYYAHKFGSVTTYTATVTVGGSGATTVDSMTVNGVEIMAGETIEATSTSALATAIANQINAMQVTDFGAKASGSVVTITGPASAAGMSPVVGKDGNMTFGVTAFAGTTATAQLNGVSPADPIQYSCQQNFSILSTDGYWNGATTYNLTGGTVGQQDGTAARPMNDGAQATTTYTYTYTREFYSKASSSQSGCSSGRKILTQPEIGTCSRSTPGSCSPSNWTANGNATLGSTCTTANAPAPSAATQQGSPVLTPGTVGGTSNTLADVAMYYYQTDLRTPALGNCTGASGTSVCENNVFISGGDNNLQQHMTTFTLGLGQRGRMVYSSSYLTDTTGDYVAVKLGSTASSTVCTWQTAGTVCNWPTPSSGAIENIDDLWHAAVNGRGAYFSATDPTTLANGLANALTTIKSKVGSAAAAATSTLNPVAGNNFAYVASYTTLKWEGNLEARGINTDTGVVSENATWCVENVAASSCASPGTVVSDTSGDTTAYFCVTPNSVVCVGGELVGGDCRVPVATACTGTMNAKVSDTTDTRVIKTANATGTALIDFDTAYRAANPSYFDAARLAGLSQWPAVADVSAEANAYRAAAVGDNLLKYLRGQRGHEYDRNSVPLADQLYRNRGTVLGDALESQPAFIGVPVFSYPYQGYAEFVTAQSSRPGTVFMGTNDGMLHAFAADTGVERWAYVPSMVVGNMWRLADRLYADKHTNYVNGSPITSDVCTANCGNTYDASTPATNPVWKTILVGGLNGGGRGYYALDITNPSSPSLLWEFTTSAGIGKVKDDDLGYTFGQAIITRKADGTWVVLVTSGYDNGTDSPVKSVGSFVANSPAGNGNGYLYVLNAGTGAIISKIATGAGTAAAPSGLAKISGFNVEPAGNKLSYVYGGDLLGNLWRFDINAADTAAIGTGKALKFATLFADAAASSPQPIMTTPQLGVVAGKRVVFIGTGKYLETADLSTTQVQTQYAIKDDDSGSTLVNPRTTLVHQYLINNPDGTATRIASGSATAATSTNNVDFFTGRGWFVDLPDSRERVNIDAKLVLGTLLVPSIVPSSTECSPGGSAWLNFFDYKTGGAVTSPGISSAKYDSTIVGINVLFIDGQPVVEVVTSTNPTPKKDPDVAFHATTAGFTGKRVSWRELIP
jgi:type IV pilus assembly protein PilY1